MARKQKKTKPLIYVFCEGESEQAYTDFLKHRFKDVAVIRRPPSVRLFEEAEARYKKDIKYINSSEVTDEIWFFFDVEKKDARKWDQRIKIIKYLRRLRKNQEIRIRLLMTTGCIEYWLMLHFKMFAPSILTEAEKKRILTELTALEPAYEKGKIESNSMRTYLVTGGAGFIGSNYIHYMFEKYGDEIFIINVDKLTYAGSLANLRGVEGRPNYRFYQADICDSATIRMVFREHRIDRVVHFAAESHVDRSIKDPEVFVRTMPRKRPGSRRTAHTGQTGSSFMSLRMRYTGHLGMLAFFMRIRPMTREAPILPARRHQTCW